LRLAACLAEVERLERYHLNSAVLFPQAPS
jgi:hypothetical protein